MRSFLKFFSSDEFFFASRNVFTAALLCSLIVLGTGFISSVFAITAATTGFASEVYNIAIQQMLGGPIGFVAGTAGVVYGAAMAIRGQFMPAAMGIIGGALLVEAPSITSSMGAVIPLK
ncbi:MAG: hypothetical protein QXH07_05425 [Thermoplasmata archaeon]